MKSKAVYSAADLFMVTHAANILNNHGVETYIKNNFLSGGIGELPVFECWPQLFVVHEYEYQKALDILATQMQNPDSAPDWICPHCRESNEGSFEICWSCGRDREESVSND